MAAVKLKRDKKGRFLPLGNMPTGSNRPRDEKGRFLPLGNVDATPSQTGSGNLKKLLVVGSVIAAAVLVYKAVQMLDIQQNIKLKMNGLSDLHLVGISAFGFTLNLSLVNTTKSSMSMSYPFVTILARRAASKNKAAKEIEVTYSKVKKGLVEIEAEAETPLSFSFEISIFTLLSVAASINYVSLFSAMIAESNAPTGENGKTNFGKIWAGTGLSFWSKTQIYANGVKVPDMVEQIF